MAQMFLSFACQVIISVCIVIHIGLVKSINVTSVVRFCSGLFSSFVQNIYVPCLSGTSCMFLKSSMFLLIQCRMASFSSCL